MSRRLAPPCRTSTTASASAGGTPRPAGRAPSLPGGTRDPPDSPDGLPRRSLGNERHGLDLAVAGPPVRPPGRRCPSSAGAYDVVVAGAGLTGLTTGRAAGPQRAVRRGAGGAHRRVRHHRPVHGEGEPAPGHQALADPRQALGRDAAALRRGEPGGPAVAAGASPPSTAVPVQVRPAYTYATTDQGESAARAELDAVPGRRAPGDVGGRPEPAVPDAGGRPARRAGPARPDGPRRGARRRAGRPRRDAARAHAGARCPRRSPRARSTWTWARPTCRPTASCWPPGSPCWTAVASSPGSSRAVPTPRPSPRRGARRACTSPATRSPARSGRRLAGRRAAPGRGQRARDRTPRARRRAGGSASWSAGRARRSP